MKFDEHLIVCLIEELSEVQKELCKCLRFTATDSFEGKSNIRRVSTEFAQVLAIMDLLTEEGLHIIAKETDIEEKKQVLKNWIEYS